jgi:uncharacterized protein YlxW (UPF0749 family)
MADETLIDKAMALLPTGRTAKKRPSAAAVRQKQLTAIQRKLATLARNVEKLAGQISAERKKAATAKKASKNPAAQKASARKPVARKPAASAPKRRGKS